jgi:hypothetical protein
MTGRIVDWQEISFMETGSIRRCQKGKKTYDKDCYECEKFEECIP